MFRGVVLEPGVIMLLLSTLPSSPRCDIVPFTGFDLNGCSLSLPDKKTREPLRSGGWSDRELQFKKFKLINRNLNYLEDVDVDVMELYTHLFKCGEIYFRKCQHSSIFEPDPTTSHSHHTKNAGYL